MRELPAILACALALAACGDAASESQRGEDAGSTASGPPAGRSGKKVPPQLAAVRAQANELLPGGPEAFKQRLRELRGYPIVVNKWASWCTPCRAEFPFFRSQAERRATEIAFFGVDTNDNEQDAAAFLEELPVPYPSYLDPDFEIAEVFHAVASFPSTAFYDRQGELVYLKQGTYASEKQLAEDIERYAVRGG